ncbi:EF hand family protein [Histomonas meleagridis]|uniref:EF hand family protein n=1 Tax=Histomonas meleagridis TaxID=135588 RepID=UPI00355A6877|nr:EF hand family protein [Histomonas meleagridis]KAH0804666.1 EF hand family protein [Histomonas meleagridis]
MGNDGSKIKVKKTKLTKKLVSDLVASTHFSEEEINILFEKYGYLSKLGHDDGTIDMEEFKEALGLRSVGFAQRIFAAFDRDNSATIEFPEYVKGLSSICPRASIDEKAKFCFGLFDVDGNGTIERQELKSVLALSMKENGSVKLTLEQLNQSVEETYRQIDTDDNGVISYDEFLGAARANPSILNCVNVDVEHLLQKK